MIGLLVLAAIAGAPAHARADDAADAKAHYDSANLHYALGEWDDAAREFKEAFRLKQNPALFFNIAQAYRQKEDWKNTALFFRRFLDGAPANVANRKLAEDLLKKAEEALAKAPAAPVAVAPVPAEPVFAVVPVLRDADGRALEEPGTLQTVHRHPSKVAEPVATTDTPTKVALPPAALAPTATTQDAPSIVGPVIGWSLTAALAIGAVIAYATASAKLTSLDSAVHPRAEADTIMTSAGTRETVSLGLGIGALASATVSALLTVGEPAKDAP